VRGTIPGTLEGEGAGNSVAPMVAFVCMETIVVASSLLATEPAIAELLVELIQSAEREAEPDGMFDTKPVPLGLVSKARALFENI